MTAARSREHDEWIPWYVEDTPGWVELSLSARGAMEGIARKLNRRTGQLALRRGLSGLAVLLHVRWDELEPALAELIAKGKVAWDDDARVLSDPDYVERKRRSGADRVADFRAKKRDVTPVTLQPLPPLPVTDVTPVLVSSSLISSDLGSEIARAPDGPPPWFDRAIEVIAMNTGFSLPVGEAWLRYDGHRAGKGIASNQRDAQYWLTTVMVTEARETARRAERDKVRDEGFKSERAALLPKAPKAENSTKLFKERDQWARDAGPPDPEAQARLNKLLGKVGTS